MQFVWVYWNGGQKDELRFSIRSVLDNFKGEAKITVVGDRPPWYRGHHINVPRVPAGQRYRAFRDSLNKLVTAANHSAIDETFVWMMDDIYFLNSVRLADLATPRFDGVICSRRMKAWRPSNKWQQIKKRTVEAIGRLPVYDYATHLPHVVTKTRLRWIFDKYKMPGTLHIWEILYGHHFYKAKDRKHYRPFFARVQAPHNYARLAKFVTQVSVLNNAEGAWREPLRAMLLDRFPKRTHVENRNAAGTKKGFDRGCPPVSPAVCLVKPPRVVAIMPWRKDPARQAGYQWVREYLDTVCDQVVIADSDGPVFSRAQAINNAVRKLDEPPETVLAIADADCVITKTRFLEGARTAAESKRLVIPHDSVCRMTAPESKSVIDKHCPTIGPRGRWYRKNRSPRCVSGLVFIRRDSFEQINGFDETFTDWGGEDNAFKIAADVLLGGVVRLDGPLFHFWHPKAEPEPDQYKRNRGRYESYRRAAAVHIDNLVNENGFIK